MPIPITARGAKMLKDELQRLKTQDRPAVVQAIAEAREKGDLSENAEYDAAKEEQAQLEERIAKLENNLRIAEVVSEQDMKQNIVNIGSTVKFSVKYPDGESEEKTVVIVGRTESNLAEGKMSNESPIGKALMGAKKGQKVDVQVPDGIAKVKVISTKF